MVRAGVGALLVLAVLLAGALLVLPPDAKALSVNPSVTIQQTSTATRSVNKADTFWHNSSTSNQSNPVSFLVNVTGYTSIQTFNFQLTISAGQFIPQIVMSQGSTIIFNATVSNQVVISPVPGTTPVSVNTVALYNVTGGNVPDGTYTIWDNVTQTIYLTDAVAGGWSLSGITFSLADTVTAPFGYFFNSTTVLFPFPSGAGVNYSSAKASPGRFAVGYGGIYGYNTSLKPTTSVTISASFQPTPINSGPAVFITLTKARLIGGTTNTWTGFGNFTNNLGLPYIGLYVLLISFSGYVLNPASISLTERLGANAAVTANPASYSVDPSDIAILPNNLLVGVGITLAIQANFSSLASPPTGCLTNCASTVLITISGVNITLGLLFEISMAAAAVYAAAVYRLYRREGRRRVHAVIVDVVGIETALFFMWVLFTIY